MARLARMLLLLIASVTFVSAVPHADAQVVVIGHGPYFHHGHHYRHRRPYYRHHRRYYRYY